MTTPAVLDREMYSEPEAARVLGVAQSTLHYWLDGEGGRGKTHKPVIRIEPRGRKASVTWAEFVEASLLKQYRQELRVPMWKLREFIELLRERFGVQYPLADRRQYVTDGGRSLVYNAQIETDLPPELCLVAMVGDQYLLTPASQSFLERVTWDGDLAADYRPHDDPKSPVRVRPDVRFGRPAIRGISTEALWEQSDAGLDDDEIAETYGLSGAEVFWALAYEKSLRVA